MALLELKTFGLDRLGHRLSELPKRIDEAAKRGIHKAALLVHRRVQERLTGRGPGNESLHVRSGKLLQALNTSAPEFVSGSWQARVGFRQGPAGKYAPVHEYGATIRAKKRLLAIPTRFARTAAGVARTITPRDYEGFWTTRLGSKHYSSPIFFGTAGGRLLPLFIGKREVRIPARKPLRASLSERRQVIRDTVREEVTRALATVAGG